MIKIMMLVNRKDCVSREEFRRNYEEVHAPLASRHLTHLARYVRNYVTDQYREGLECDCVTEFWFDHPGRWAEARDELLPAAMLELFARDEETFMDRDSMRVLVVEESETAPGDLLGNSR
ncbi:MAG: EthD domain-containing protein [Novosphingobium sp.]|nr:EthD domain-containing protein [Novosphingobium sp.]